MKVDKSMSREKEELETTLTNVILCALAEKVISVILPSTPISKTSIKDKTHLISKSLSLEDNDPAFLSIEMMLIVIMINI